MTFEYKPADASDYAYSTNVPTQAGNYNVRAIIAETENYEGVTVTKDDPFTIAKKHVAANVTVMPKEYDGFPDATVFATVSEGLINGDSIAISDVAGLFANESPTETDANVGEDKPVHLDASGAIRKDRSAKTLATARVARPLMSAARMDRPLRRTVRTARPMGTSQAQTKRGQTASDLVLWQRCHILFRF